MECSNGFRMFIQQQIAYEKVLEINPIQTKIGSTPIDF